ncbi:peptidylprolyl isomerase [Deefgea salmonis]|uniref:peptidylprolyl isomerase n=1 Tax=Deefgea salmonis TaxID=2875502 RepID=A0ABS8BJG4_9NEIS|nr:peptidylprolyl isomerase [Deefgea salmonis]MCB5195849.1 peptidylprolyl isomerase [Deefgea salmonis]
MAIIVNGVEISEASIENELAQHAEAESPRDAAIQELILRELLLQTAKKEGITAPTTEEIIGTLLEKAIPVEEADEAACLDFYNSNPESFTKGEMASANHILFPLGEGLTAGIAKAKAEGVLADVLANPSKFADLAREHSTCPSSAQGGSLGQFGRGQMVPEFEAAIFSTEAGVIVPTLVETQFGYHIIEVTERSQGDSVSFEEVKERLQAFLTDMAGRKAMHDYLGQLVTSAKIEGYSLPAMA